MDFLKLRIVNGSNDLVIKITKTGQTDSNLIPSEIAKVSQLIEQNKQDLISSLPTNLKYSLQTSNIKASGKN